MQGRCLEIEAQQRSAAFPRSLSRSEQTLSAWKGQTESRHETIGKEAGFPQPAQILCNNIFSVK